MLIHRLTNNNGFMLCLIALILSIGCAGPRNLEKQQIATFERDATWDVLDMEVRYLLYLPPGYNAVQNANRRWPLIIYMHGIGENGGDPSRIANVPGLPRDLETGLDVPAIIVSPHNTGEMRDLWYTDAMVALIENVEQRYRVDPDRIYLTGVSLGAYTAWSMASIMPQRFAAIVPVSGWGYPDEVPNMRDLNVWAFHGENDLIVPQARHRALIEAHRRAGGDARWTVIQGRGHDAAAEVYSNPELYDWLLQQKR